MKKAPKTSFLQYYWSALRCQLSILKTQVTSQICFGRSLTKEELITLMSDDSLLWLKSLVLSCVNCGSKVLYSLVSIVAQKSCSLVITNINQWYIILNLGCYLVCAETVFQHKQDSIQDLRLCIADLCLLTQNVCCTFFVNNANWSWYTCSRWQNLALNRLAH